jgi:hypothetical protein
MSTIIESAEAKRREAIQILVAERQAIDEALTRLGYDGTEVKKDRKQLTCGRCGANGHTARTCPTPPEPQ